MDNSIEQKAAQAILDKGVRYRIEENNFVVLRPLKFGTVLTISEELCRAGLTLQKIEEGENNLPPFLSQFGETMLQVVAIAMINDKEKLKKESLISEKSEYLKSTLTTFQIYELFAYIVNLSGMQAFTNTIRLAFSMKTMNLSPKASQGS